MKSNLFKFSLIALFCLVLVGCNQDDAEDQLVTSFTTEETELNAKVDNATEVVSDTFLQVYEYYNY